VGVKLLFHTTGRT